MIKEEAPRLDVRAKIIILVLINLIAVFNKSILFEIISMSLISLTLVYSKLYKKAILYSVYYLILMILFYFSSTVTNPLTSIILVVCMFFRKVVPVITFGYCIVTTTKVSELLVGLEMLRFPRSIRISFSVILSYIPSLGVEFTNITNAMKMRGFGLTPVNAIIHPLRTSENVIVPLIVRSSTIAEEISAAAITRGIESTQKRTTYYPMKFKVLDFIFVSAFTLLLILSLLNQNIGGSI